MPCKNKYHTYSEPVEKVSSFLLHGTTTTAIPSTTATSNEDIGETAGPQAAPVITDAIIPLAPPVLPKTGELPLALFYGIGGLVTAAGLFIRRK